MAEKRLSFDERVNRIMKALNLTREEAEQCVRDDDIIDKGGTCDWEVPMTAEQKKMIRQLHSTDRKVGTQKVKREKKVDDNKKALIATISNALADVEDLVIVNDEREITFTFNGTAYKIVLSAPRAAKAD